jgi:zinc protease
MKTIRARRRTRSTVGLSWSIAAAMTLGASAGGTLGCNKDGATVDPDQAAETGPNGETLSERELERRARATEAEEKRAMLQALPELPGVTKSKAVVFPEPVVSTLDNGLELIVLQDSEVPVVDIRLSIGAGKIYSPSESPVLAEITAGMLSEGTKKNDKAAFDQRVDDTGGSAWANSGTERASVGASVLSSDVKTAMKWISEQVQEPAFPADALDKIKDQAKESLEVQKSQPSTLVAALGARLMFGEDSPYGRPFPKEEEIDRITLAEVKTFWAKHYVAGNAMIVVSGDITPDAAKKSVEKAFGKWGKGDPVPVPAATQQPALDKPMVHIIDRPKSLQATVGVFVTAPKIGEKGWLELQVTEQLLSGGLSSALNQVLREQLGLTYGTYASHSFGFDGGAFAAIGGTKGRTTDQFVDAMLPLFTGPGESIDAAALERTKKKMSGSFALAVEGVDVVASRTVTARVFGLPDGFWAKYRTDIESVTAEDILAATKGVLDPSRIQVVALGRRKRLEGQLEDYGEIKVYDTDLQPVE